MARMRFLGSPWTRRSDTPILGLSGVDRASRTARCRVSIVSTENRDLGYQSPPGVVDQVADAGGDQQSGGTQINERSRSASWREDLRQGERAEAYLRFPAGPQNLLTYRTLRVWFRGRGAGLGGARSPGLPQAGQRRRQLLSVPGVRPDRRPGSPRRSSTSRPGGRLRADLENRWLSGRAAFRRGGVRHPEPRRRTSPARGPTWSTSPIPGSTRPTSPRCRSSPPASTGSAAPVTVPQVELWVDDIRLSDPVSETGTAMSLDARLAASDVGNLSAAYTSGRTASSARSTRTRPTAPPTRSRSTGNLRLDRFLPTSFGLAMPLTVTTPARTWTRSCSPAPISAGTRSPGFASRSHWSTTYALTLRRSRQGTNWLTKGLLDPLAFTGSLTRGRAQTELSDASASTYALGLTYQLRLRRRGFRLPLGGLVGHRAPGSEGDRKVAQSRGLQPGAYARPLRQRSQPERGQRDRVPVCRWRAATTGCSRRRSRSPTSGATRPDSPGSRSAC